MSAPELDQLEVIRRIDQRLLTQRKAAQLLGLSVRQVKRLVAHFRATRAPVLISKKAPDAQATTASVNRFNANYSPLYVNDLRI